MDIAIVCPSAATIERGDDKLNEYMTQTPTNVGETTASGSALEVVGATAAMVALGLIDVIGCMYCPTLARPSHRGNVPSTTR